MILTSDNYHSPEANMFYMSNSQYKDFLTCEAMAMAKIAGEWSPEPSIDFLVGSYIHAWNEGSEALEKFKAETPEMFSSKGATKGELKSNFVLANQMIEALQNDSFCSYMLEGEKEVIMTAEMFGAPWKIKIDTYKPSDSIVDLKTTRSIWEQQWSEFYNCRVSFIETYQYFIQFAIYLEIERLNAGSDRHLSPYIVAVSKETPPDKAVIDLNDPARISHELHRIEANMPRILAVKSGSIAPIYCGKCAYCRSVKTVTDIISYRDLEQREAV